jgi:hypothetical protein
VNEALRLSPRDNRAWLWVHFSASAKLHLGMGEEAVIATPRPLKSLPARARL